MQPRQNRRERLPSVVGHDQSVAGCSKENIIRIGRVNGHTGDRYLPVVRFEKGLTAIEAHNRKAILISQPDGALPIEIGGDYLAGPGIRQRYPRSGSIGRLVRPFGHAYIECGRRQGIHCHGSDAVARQSGIRRDPTAARIGCFEDAARGTGVSCGRGARVGRQRQYLGGPDVGLRRPRMRLDWNCGRVLRWWKTLPRASPAESQATTQSRRCRHSLRYRRRSGSR